MIVSGKELVFRSSIYLMYKPCYFIACFHGDTRLTVPEGEVEENVVQICYKGAWRFVCMNSDWGTLEANIVCQQVGFGGETINSARILHHYNCLMHVGATIALAGVEGACFEPTSERSNFLRLFNCSGTATSTLDCYYEARDKCNEKCGSNQGVLHANVFCSRGISS